MPGSYLRAAACRGPLFLFSMMHHLYIDMSSPPGAERPKACRRVCPAVSGVIGSIPKHHTGTLQAVGCRERECGCLIHACLKKGLGLGAFYPELEGNLIVLDLKQCIHRTQILSFQADGHCYVGFIHLAGSAIPLQYI